MSIEASVIVRCCNEGKYIGKLLSGIMSQKADFKYEIILVDSGSTDDTLEKARQYPVTIVEISPENFSFGYSLNKGIERSTGRVAVFISAHCYPEDENWLKEMVLPFGEERTAMVYGRQRGDETTRFAERRIFEKWFPNESVKAQGHPFCNNANAAVRRSLWEEHRYDETLSGLEDLAWADNIQSLGYQIHYNADALIIHVHNETYRQIYNRYKREAIAFHRIFKNETFTLWDFCKLFCLNLFSDYDHALEEGCFLKEFFDIKLFRFQQFRGTYMGFKHKKELSPQLRRIFYYPVKKNK